MIVVDFCEYRHRGEGGLRNKAYIKFVSSVIVLANFIGKFILSQENKSMNKMDLEFHPEQF